MHKTRVFGYPVIETTPQSRNLYFSNISVVNAERAAQILGLPEMPLENLQLRNIEVHSAKSGIQYRQTEGAKFESLVVNAQNGPALDVRNASDLQIDEFTTQKPGPDTSVILLENVDSAVISDCCAARYRKVC